jgi:hypothetical protein
VNKCVPPDNQRPEASLLDELRDRLSTDSPPSRGLGLGDPLGEILCRPGNIS